MKRSYKIGLIGLISIVIFFGGIQFFAMLLMQKEDFRIDIDDLKTDFQDGDLIFQTSKSDQSIAIQLATKSEYSHMGMIYKINNKVFVFEAVQPVKLTPINDWIERGEKGKYIVKRLKDSETLLTPEIKERMKKTGEKYLGKDYDIYFDWSDERIYCSELVWKIYKESINIEIGKLETLKDFDLSNKTVKQKLTERYGNNIPINEKVISPISMFNSEKLRTIYEEK